MSEPMKKPHIDGVRVYVGIRKPRVFVVPREKAIGMMSLLRDYEVETDPGAVPWREPFKKEIEQHSEGGVMGRGARGKMGITPVELAKKLGTAQGNVAAMETGKRPIGKTMAKRIAEVLNVDYRVFL